MHRCLWILPSPFTLLFCFLLLCEKVRRKVKLQSRNWPLLTKFLFRFMQNDGWGWVSVHSGQGSGSSHGLIRRLDRLFRDWLAPLQDLDQLSLPSGQLLQEHLLLSSQGLIPWNLTLSICHQFLQYFILKQQWVLASKTYSEWEHPFHNIIIKPALTL